MSNKLLIEQATQRQKIFRQPSIQGLAKFSRLGLQILPLLIVLFVWELASGSWSDHFKFLEAAVLGKPSGIASELIQLVASGDILIHVWVTFQEALGGLAVAIVAGVSLGIILSYSRQSALLTLPYIQILNSIPRIALAPFFIVWFGIGLTSKVILAALTAFFPIFFTTYQGLSSIEQELVDAFQVMGASRLQILRMVILPAVMTWVIAGIRTSLGMALVGAIVAEYVGSTKGLGFLLMAAQGVLNVDRAWAVLVVLAVIGVFLDWSIRRLEAHILRWRTTAREL
ncbi:ABC transporter permease [Chlorogloeopsis sp. ULAP01]|uniref:ABC transporter permease n=1 Tax=Chlorogloeopsis sp. ULAP01 TaxID=3056483 RepID=UPI0025AB42DB|nr:ABC transporter permease [Chlorogloeopsis sp. ULAP01]MDM9384024.1 ABC transporter permease [Chlorogloeopsis sp. ULAP01]